MLQMKFKPRFIEAFRSGQKVTSLRMLDFKCARCDHYENLPVVYAHSDTLKHRMRIETVEGLELSLPPGSAVKYTTDLTGLLERQPYKRGDEIELVTEAEGGETVPFATATIIGLYVVKGEEIDRDDAIHDGFNPDRDPLAELHAFMRDVYHTADPVKEMYWRYVLAVQMLPQWGGEA
ncbi:ASCH domain-containing protein [Salmonella enterica]|nr:ASCH domain-containing protein [Salmonella enterica]